MLTGLKMQVMKIISTNMTKMLQRFLKLKEICFFSLKGNLSREHWDQNIQSQLDGFQQFLKEKESKQTIKI